MYLCIYIFLHLSLSIYISISISLYPSIFLSMYACMYVSLSIYLSIYLYLSIYVYASERSAHHILAFTRYFYHQYYMVYSIQTGVRRGSRTLSYSGAIELHQGGQCRWAWGVTGWLIRAQQPRSKRISCKGQITLQRAQTPLYMRL